MIKKSAIPEKIRGLIESIDEAARKNGTAAFLVGGFVRDLLLGIKNLDVDILIEGDAIKVAKDLSDRVGGRCMAYKKFGTATLTLEDLRIDFATARKERYEKPSRPAVEFSSIKEDLFRRDFTINAMAMDISARDFGRIVDYFGGQSDLENKRVRVLHDKSFIDDPTRILRAIRFEQRLGFKIEPRTERLLKEAIEANLLKGADGLRLKNEVALISKEKRCKAILTRMERLGIDIPPHPYPLPKGEREL